MTHRGPELDALSLCVTLVSVPQFLATSQPGCLKQTAAAPRERDKMLLRAVLCVVKVEGREENGFLWRKFVGSMLSVSSAVLMSVMVILHPTPHIPHIPHIPHTPPLHTRTTHHHYTHITNTNTTTDTNNNSNTNTTNNNNNTNTIWEGSILTGEEPPPHSGELKHALSQAGGPTQSQLSRPVSSRHHISMEHRLRRKQLL